MSFYGQVLYEFSRLFSKINIENSDNESAAETNLDGQDSLTPTEEWDQLNLVGGNRWIQLNSNKNNKTITISHTAPNADAEGSSISIITPLDKANEPETGIIPLEQGQCLKVSNYIYDNAGHIANMNHEYFSLPRVQGYDDFVDLSDRLTTVEQTYVSNEKSDTFSNLTEAYLTENQYVKQEALEDSIGNYLDENNYVTTQLTGTLDIIHGDNSTSSIADTIGSVNQDTNSIRSEFNKFFGLEQEEYTISEAILKLLNTIKMQDALIANLQLANKGLDGDIQTLTARVEALENLTK